MKGIFTYDRWGMLQRFVGKLVEWFSRFQKTVIFFVFFGSMLNIEGCILYNFLLSITNSPKNPSPPPPPIKTPDKPSVLMTPRPLFNGLKTRGFFWHPKLDMKYPSKGTPSNTPGSQGPGLLPRKHPQMLKGIPNHKLLGNGVVWVCSFRGMLESS